MIQSVTFSTTAQGKREVRESEGHFHQIAIRAELR